MPDSSASAAASALLPPAGDRPGSRPALTTRPRSSWARIEGSWADVLPQLPQADVALARVPVESTLLENPSAHIVVSRWPGKAAVPVGLVSRRYQLAGHATVLKRVVETLGSLGVRVDGAHLTADLPVNGERLLAVLRIDDPGLAVAPDGHPCAFSAYVRNSVEGRGALDVRLGWFRLICSNGLLIGQSAARYAADHRPGLSLDDLADSLTADLDRLKINRELLEVYGRKALPAHRLDPWTDNVLARAWGVTAATRVVHILRTGTDPREHRPDLRLPPSRQRPAGGEPVPGRPGPGTTAYDALQALTWVASHTGGPTLRDERTRQAHRLLLRLFRN